ncbi:MULTISPECIES: glycosyltransferase family 2 protein [unclassified Enterococcus]|uniref:glycosyltransferase family 2 protein n=1 Tax=unclassified Enterococcus TaxID=2608891 RepID=UPI00155577FA|nr:MULTISPECIES: glycosyltransferase family 2 protein [unclassified Enterococcus]MBS7577872.1 glycosyltransferase family 2 protein [Enterococcus sp. MMGLQ5-2]MBS7585132.1 glycosyltransferase family 2 protein [Enterococcus sp. MMGLQ5-1]NPD12988.1 glycosyltransferase family 2 protein [Enterococcus sp. MMGLQ5-1]NPD37702.1 glycosyltransferase family 2 protein [Enterococcus sp. MMGLQ5-2]
MKVNILLSTYNGERFLTQQIESILAQSFRDWRLLIRDDGSTDRTVEIIREFAELDSRILFINNENIINLGVIQSFFVLTKFDQADYYFYCDQDDIWLPDKLTTILNAASEAQLHQPAMYYTDLKVVDEQLQILSDSMIATQSHHANTTLIEELAENSVTGCTSMINDELAQLWTNTEQIIMHDWYLALLATAVGQLVYIDVPTILYRQHSENVLGARTFKKRMSNWLNQPVNRYWKLIHQAQKQAEKIANENQVQMTSSQLEVLNCFVDIDQQSISERVRRISRYRYRKNRLFHTMILRALLITNWFNPR